MALSDLLARLTGRRREPERPVLARVPTSADLLAALDAVESMVAHGVVPAPVASRVTRVSRTVRDTIPRLSNLGAGSLQVCTAVMHYGYRIVEDLCDGLSNWMDSKGFVTVADLCKGIEALCEENGIS